MEVRLVPFKDLFKQNTDELRYTNIDMFRFHGTEECTLYEKMEYDDRIKLIKSVKNHILNKLSDRQEVFVLKIDGKVLCQNLKTHKVSNHGWNHNQKEEPDQINCPIIFNADTCRKAIGSTTIMAYDRFASGYSKTFGPGIRYLFIEHISYKPGSILYPCKL